MQNSSSRAFTQFSGDAAKFLYETNCGRLKRRFLHLPFVGSLTPSKSPTVHLLRRFVGRTSFRTSSILATRSSFLPAFYPESPLKPRLQPRTQSVTHILMANTPPKSFYRRKLPNNLVDLKSTEGKARFKSALEGGNAEAFFPLVSQFQTQSHPALCGLTTLTTVLNALEIDPKRVWNHPWRWFAESLLECCLDMENVKASGITMDQLACTAGCQGSIVGTWRGLSVDEARELIKKSVRGRPDGSFEFVVASYDRRSLGQTGTGHFSPVAAFDERTDSVLVLDVARFKYGPHWVQVQDLVEATRPVDSSCGLPRGFMTFRKFGDEHPVATGRAACKEPSCNGALVST